MYGAACRVVAGSECIPSYRSHGRAFFLGIGRTPAWIDMLISVPPIASFLYHKRDATVGCRAQFCSSPSHPSHTYTTAAAYDGNPHFQMPIMYSAMYSMVCTFLHHRGCVPSKCFTTKAGISPCLALPCLPRCSPPLAL